MNLRSALLPSLGVFAAAARHQNFAHAADELHLTASAVSHHVRKLEASLGVPLFQRHARGVVLTGEGRLLADAATAAVADLDAVAQSLGRTGDRHRLRINTLHSLAYCWLLPRLPRFLSAHPDIRVSIDTGSALTRFEACSRSGRPFALIAPRARRRAANHVESRQFEYERGRPPAPHSPRGASTCAWPGRFPFRWW